MVFDEVPNISNVGDFFVCSILETIIKLYSRALYEHTCANLSEKLYTPLPLLVLDEQLQITLLSKRQLSNSIDLLPALTPRLILTGGFGIDKTGNKP